METLTNAVKLTGLTRAELMRLINDGYIAYATNDNKSAYLVDMNDIAFHRRQVMLRGLNEELFIQAYHKQIINRMRHEQL